MPTPRFGLPFIAQGQAQKEVTHNDALIQLDALVDLFILDRNLATPPGSPVDGDTYLVAASPTGAWAGQAGKLAHSVDGAWRFYSPLKGLLAYVADEQAILIYTGSSWVDWSTLLSFQNLPMLGVNTAADATNKLAAKTNAVLFDALRAANGGNGDIQVKLSKEAAGDTASFLFQSNYSGRAEIGLAGDDDFSFKVSPDGSSWFQAFKISAASGLITPLAGGIAGGGRLKSVQYFSANGTWNRPTGIRWALAEVLGAGGGSGGCTGAASSVAVGAGGAGGGYSRKLIDVTTIASVAVTVGTGGTAGANTGTAGGTGGTSSFGAHCSATGGGGGAGMTTGTAVAVSQGGLGGQGASGDYDFAGAPGSHGIRLSGTVGISGNGGAGFFGGGARGNIGNAAGSAGNSRGSGASGAATNSATAQAGAVGAAGLVVVWEFE